MKKGNHAIKAVRYTLKSLYPQGHLGFRIEVGETYHSEEGYSVCDSIPATFKYYPYPALTRYLEVELLSDAEKIEEHSYKVKDIKVLRVISVKELEQDPDIVEYWNEWNNQEKKKELMEFLQKESAEISKRKDTRVKKIRLIALIPLILLALYAVVPMLLAYFGIIK
jgi:hypothetical protein